MLIEFLLFVLSLVGLWYLALVYLRGNNDYWDKLGIPRVLPGEVASFYELFTKKKTLVGMDEDYYHNLKKKGKGFGGIMEFRKPMIMLTDLDLLRYILVKDFDTFMDRRKIEFGKDEIMNETLVSLHGQRWKDVRGSVSPTFTTGKIRRMFDSFNRCGKMFVEYINRLPTSSDCGGGHDLIIQDLMSRFTVDVIGATAFGMETNAMKEEDSMFFKMAKKMSDISAWRLAKNMFYIMFPKLGKLLGLRIIDEEVGNFFIGILKRAFITRENSNEVRDDFLQLMIEVKKGTLKEDDEELDQFEKEAQMKSSSKGKIVFTDNLAMAQSFIFFVAGFDTVGALANFAAYLMAVHQDIQQKLYDEVELFMQKNGEIDYDSVCKLEYVDMFISEILRRYPPANRLERKCMADYELPGTGFTIPKDMLVAISVQGIHMDEEFYPEPKKFDPERFTTENKAKRHPYAYLPFGQGPRNCIGMRFALMEVKIVVAYMAYYFLIEPTAKTPIPVKIDEKIGFNRPTTNLELRFTPRSH